MLKKFVVVFLLAGALFSTCLYFMFSSTVTAEQGVVYYLRAGTSRQALSTELSQQDIIRHPWIFSLYIHLNKKSSLKTGEYLFRKGATPYSIWRQVVNGTGHYYRAFTIIPGWSFAQLRRELLITDTLKHNTQQLDNKQIMALLGASNIDPEGEFFPETYYYTRDVPDLVILKRAYDLMQLRLNEVWQRRQPGLPYQSAYEVLIAASLVEKEAFLNSERKIIAGVLINRLRKNMLLQFDPTVIYGMGDRYHGKIHREDLREDTSYNTYIHKGLPPTPISMPSQASLDAAVQPAAHDYYYFVARGDGGHQFSKTLPEHHIAVDTAIKQQAGPGTFNE